MKRWNRQMKLRAHNSTVVRLIILFLYLS